MANDFIIKKGHSTRLGLIAQEDLIENGWYLTTDTAEVYVALRQSNGLLELKKINECNIDTDLDLESFETRLESLEADHTHMYGYRKDFPKTGEVNHLYVAADQKKTYVFTMGQYLPIADQFDYTDHDNNSETPEVRIIFGGSAN
jgi:hypothetical protein